MKAAGNWCFDVDKAPKNGTPLILLTSKGSPIIAFWSKYQEEEKSTIALPEGHKPRIVESAGWVAAVGPGVIVLDSIVAYAKLRLPKLRPVKRGKNSVGGNNGHEKRD